MPESQQHSSDPVADDGIPITDEPIRVYTGNEVSKIVKARLAKEKEKHANQLKAAVLATAAIFREQAEAEAAARREQSERDQNNAIERAVRHVRSGRRWPY